MSEIKITHIITASQAPDIENKKYLELARENLTALGLQYDEMDIKGKSEDELRQALKDKDVIYVNGGNTYYLLKAVQESGFGKVIDELLDQGVIYIGASAGSSIMTPDIEITDWRPEGKKRPRYDLEDLTALNYVSFGIKVHWDRQSEEEKEIVKTRAKKYKYPVRLLKDYQGFLVKGDKVELVGEGDEVKL